jgi:hypothetical protein
VLHDNKVDVHVYQDSQDGRSLQDQRQHKSYPLPSKNLAEPILEALNEETLRQCMEVEIETING